MPLAWSNGQGPTVIKVKVEEPPKVEVKVKVKK